MEKAFVLNMVTELTDEMQNIMEHETEKFQALNDKFSKLLHPNHYQLQILRRHLAGSFRGNLTLQQVELRLQLVEDFIRIFHMVDPGLTKWRGKMLFQVCKTKMFLADIKHSKEEMDKEKFLTEMKESIEGMEEVVKCLQDEPNGCLEWKVSQMAQANIAQATEVLSMIKSLG